MPNIFIENFEEFKIRMGCEFVTIPLKDQKFLRDNTFVEEHYLFANAGRSDGHRSHQGPPNVPEHRAALIHQFWSTTLENKRNEYDNFLSTLQTQNQWHGMGCSNSCDVVYPGYANHLTKLKKEVQDLDKKVTELTNALPKDPRQQLIAQKQEARHHKCQETRERLKAAHLNF